MLTLSSQPAGSESRKPSHDKKPGMQMIVDFAVDSIEELHAILNSDMPFIAGTHVTYETHEGGTRTYHDRARMLIRVSTIDRVSILRYHREVKKDAYAAG